MKKTIYRFLSLLLVIILMIPALPVHAADTSGQCGPSLYWSFKSNLLTISGTGEMYDFTKRTPQNLPTEMPWRNYLTGISRIVIEEGCTRIGSYAFYNTSSLCEIVFPKNSLKSIGDYAFADCAALERAYLPDSVETLGTAAFRYCSKLSIISFGSSYANIPDSLCFSDTSLKTVIMSENCRSLGVMAFQECTSLTDIDVSRVEVFGSS